MEQFLSVKIFQKNLSEILSNKRTTGFYCFFITQNRRNCKVFPAQILPTLRFYLFADLVIDRGGSFERPVQQNNTPSDPGRHYKRKKRCTVVCAFKISCFYFRRKRFFSPQSLAVRGIVPLFSGFFPQDKVHMPGSPIRWLNLQGFPSKLKNNGKYH
jgi:hypothetical protein